MSYYYAIVCLIWGIIGVVLWEIAGEICEGFSEDLWRAFEG